MTRILITNNGPHSSEQWAVASAEMICDIDSSIVGDRLLAAKKLQLDIAEALMSHYSSLQTKEQQKLKADPDYIMAQHDVSDYLDNVLKDIESITTITQWKSHFKEPEVIKQIRSVIENHFITSQHVDRLWFADKNQHLEQAQLYKRKF